MSTIKMDSLDKNENMCVDGLSNGEISKNPSVITIPVFRNLKIVISKPLIPLKMMLFLWYGSTFSLITFLFVFFRQKGMPIGIIYNVYSIANLTKLIGPTICGIIADKTGQPKTVLFANVFLITVVVIALLLVPYPPPKTCETIDVQLKCQKEPLGLFIAENKCSFPKPTLKLISCNMKCSKNVTEFCSQNQFMCETLQDNETLDNFPLDVRVNKFHQLNSTCFYNISHNFNGTIPYFWCDFDHKVNCSIICSIEPDDYCKMNKSIKSLLRNLNYILLILFFTFASSAFRIIDVQGMILVEKYKGDFGQQRIFGILGMLSLSPLTGYLIDITTTDKDVKNYAAAFYFCLALIFLSLPVFYKLEVQLKPPGKNLWKESIQLLKNPDVIPFLVLLLILGSSYGFSRSYVYLYLEEMKVPAILLGLIISVGSLYCFPFLYYSKWWVKRIGTKNMFLLALLGYVIHGIGYSYLYNPWFSLMIEATNIITYHLLWVTIVFYCHKISPECLKSTTNAIAGGIHYGLGKGVGALIFGSVVSAHGGRMAYRCMALMCFITGILYVFYLFLRKVCCIRIKKEEKVKTESAEIYDETLMMNSMDCVNT